LLGLTAGNFDGNSIELLDGNMLVFILGGKQRVLLGDTFVLLENEVLGLFVCQSCAGANT